MEENKKDKYDVIIAGASFAGLAVASKIKSGKVLLVDRKPVGTGIKSACGTVLDTVRKLELENSILQIHRKIVIHFAFSDLTYDLEPPFCVIDGEIFCRGLFKKGKADLVQASILGLKDAVIKTDKGNFKADIFVDASGPECVLAKDKNNCLSFGIETTVNSREEGLHFWYLPKIFPKGVFWLFPQGNTSRVGIGSYVGETKLMPYLDEFLKMLKLEKIGGFHGGYFPYRIQEPVSGNIFRVGDAAGQCFPLTGEGIRPAVFFGQRLGEIVDLVLEGKIPLAEGLNSYRKFVFEKRRRRSFEKLYWLQKIFTNCPERIAYLCAQIANRKSTAGVLMKRYLNFL